MIENEMKLINKAMSKGYILLDDFLEIFKDSGVPVLTKRVNAIKLIRRIENALKSKPGAFDDYYVEIKNEKTGRISYILKPGGVRFYFWNLPNSKASFPYQIGMVKLDSSRLDASAKKAWETNPEGMQAMQDWAASDGSKQGLMDVLVKHGGK